MTPYELTSLSLIATNQLDMSWVLFLSIHAAVFGGIVYIDRPLKKGEKIVLIISYSAIAIYNFYLTRRSQKLLQALYQDISELKITQNLEMYSLDYFSKITISEWGWASQMFTIVTHVFALIIVFVAVILGDKLKK